MTINDLTKILQGEQKRGRGDLEVVIIHNYGDRPSTTIAEEPYHFDKGFIARSVYHDSDRVVEEGDKDSRPVLLIGGE